MSGIVVKQKSFPGGQVFCLVVNDLLVEPVECIVNAANGLLAHGGGVAAAIAAAAGDDLWRECRGIISRRGEIPVGEAVVTTAGQLPFKGVIHAMGPRQGEGNEEKKIVCALRAAFTIAEVNDWRSLAFPAVSSGIFAVPFPVCASAYLQSVREHWSRRPDSPLREIHLCLFQGPLLDVVTEAWPRFFPEGH